MTSIRSTCLLVFGMIAAPLAAAAAETPQQYSHAMPLTVSGKNALVQLPLPKDVYLNSRSLSLDDLRLFDKRGASMPFALTSLEGEQLVASSEAAAPVDTLVVAPRPGKFVGDLVYPSPIAIPVRTLGLQVAQQNVVVRAVMGRYVKPLSFNKGQSKGWQFDPTFIATFYQMTESGRTRRSADVYLNGRHADEWVLRTPATLAPPPSLRLSWQPATLIFRASGNAPYTLAVGRPDASSAQVDIETVAPALSGAQLAALERAVAGPAVEQGPDTSAADSVARDGRIILGGLLGECVIILAMLANAVRSQRRNTAPEGNG